MEQRRSRIHTLLLCAAATALLPACNFDFRDDAILAKVGAQTITRKDARYRDQVIQVYYPNEHRKGVGLHQLIEAFTQAEVLYNNGVRITKETLDEEERRIDRSTQLPELLWKIKAIFGQDHDAYQKDYVLPTYAERIIYFDFFLKNAAIQKDSLVVAEGFLERALKSPGKTLTELAKGDGRSATHILVSKDFGIKARQDYEDELPGHPEMPSDNPMKAKLESQRKLAMNAEGERWFRDVIGPLKKGRLFPKVIDQQEHWQVVRLLGPAKNPKGAYELESVAFPKADFAKWFDRERSKIRVNRYD